MTWTWEAAAVIFIVTYFYNEELQIMLLIVHVFMGAGILLDIVALLLLWDWARTWRSQIGESYIHKSRLPFGRWLCLQSTPTRICPGRPVPTCWVSHVWSRSHPRRPVEDVRGIVVPACMHLSHRLGSLDGSILTTLSSRCGGIQLEHSKISTASGEGWDEGV